MAKRGCNALLRRLRAAIRLELLAVRMLKTGDGDLDADIIAWAGWPGSRVLLLSLSRAALDAVLQLLASGADGIKSIEPAFCVRSSGVVAHNVSYI